jgi:hypothetical protein
LNKKSIENHFQKGQVKISEKVLVVNIRMKSTQLQMYDYSCKKQVEKFFDQKRILQKDALKQI